MITTVNFGTFSSPQSIFPSLTSDDLPSTPQPPVSTVHTMISVFSEDDPTLMGPMVQPTVNIHQICSINP